MIEAVPDPPTPPATGGVVLRHGAAVCDALNNALLFFQAGRINREAVQALELKKQDVVLDVGCAAGATTFAAARHLDAQQGGLAIGIDASPEMIRHARTRINGRPCRFDIVAAEKTPYRDGTFDKAISTMFFHHLNLAAKSTALAEIRRVLKPGGIFVIVDVDVPTTMLGRISARSGEWLFKQPEIGENSDGRFAELLESAGFDSVERVAHYLGYITSFKLVC